MVVVSKFRSLLVAAAMCSLTACATPGTDDSVSQEDPLEGFNRTVFAFNEYVDRLILRPLATGYVTIVPEFGRERVSDFLSNLTMPVVFINSVLQADAHNAFSSFWSFVLNSSFGMGGLYDFAGTYTDLRVHNEDFGQSMGVWGVGQGAYLVLPVFGPSSTRDAAGLVADYFTDPFNYDDTRWTMVARGAMTAVDRRANNMELINDLYDNSLDAYATLRSAYLQKRRADVKNTKSEVPLEDK